MNDEQTTDELNMGISREISYHDGPVLSTYYCIDGAIH